MEEIESLLMPMVQGGEAGTGDQGGFKPGSAERDPDGNTGEMAEDPGREKGMGAAPEKTGSQPPTGEQTQGQCG